MPTVHLQSTNGEYDSVQVEELRPEDVITDYLDHLYAPF
jgi:hypothetical protein